MDKVQNFIDKYSNGFYTTLMISDTWDEGMQAVREAAEEAKQLQSRIEELERDLEIAEGLIRQQLEAGRDFV